MLLHFACSGRGNHHNLIVYWYQEQWTDFIIIGDIGTPGIVTAVAANRIYTPKNIWKSAKYMEKLTQDAREREWCLQIMPLCITVAHLNKHRAAKRCLTNGLMKLKCITQSKSSQSMAFKLCLQKSFLIY